MKKEEYVLVLKMRNMTVGEQTKMAIESRKTVKQISKNSRCIMAIGERRKGNVNES